MAFEKLSVEAMRKARPFLLNNFPASAMVLNILDLTLKESYPVEDRVEIYGFNGVPDDWKSLFLVAMLKPNLQEFYSIIYPPADVTEPMLKAFTDLHDWTRIQEFGAVPESFDKHLDDIILAKKGTVKKGPAADLYLPVEEALKFDLSRPDLEAEFEVDKLAPEHARTVSDNWKFGCDAHIPSISEAIRTLGSAGVFKKRDTKDIENGRRNADLVSWVVLLRLGTMNALHTLDAYRGKGLARWTMQAASKWWAEQGLVPLVEVETYNDTSRQLVERLGFKFIQNVNWIQFFPTTEL